MCPVLVGVSVSFLFVLHYLMSSIPYHTSLHVCLRNISFCGFCFEQRDTNGLTAENSELKLRLQTMEQQVHLQDGKHLSCELLLRVVFKFLLIGIYSKPYDLLFFLVCFCGDWHNLTQCE